MSSCYDNFRNNPKYQTINRWVLVGLNSLSWIFSIVTLASCTFVKMDLSSRRLNDIPSPNDIANDYGIDLTTDYGIPDYGNPDYSSPDYNKYGGGDYSASQKFGIFSYEYDGGCEKIDGDIGSGQKASRAFGVISNLCLFVGLIFILLVIFVLPVKISKRFWISTRVLYIIAFVGNLLTFSIWSDLDCKEDDTCKYFSLGGAGIVTALNVFLLIGIITLSWFVPIPEKPVFSFPGGVRDASPSVQSSEVAGKPAPPVEHFPNGSRDTSPDIQSSEVGNQTPVEHKVISIDDSEIAVSVGPSASVEHIAH